MAAPKTALLRRNPTLHFNDSPLVALIIAPRRKGVISLPEMPCLSASASASAITPSIKSLEREISEGAGTQKTEPD